MKNRQLAIPTFACTFMLLALWIFTTEGENKKNDKQKNKTCLYIFVHKKK